MDIEEFRRYCLSFQGAHEGMPFEGFFKNSRSILVFYVKEKMFCFFDVDSFDSCTLKCDSNEIPELKEKYQDIELPFNLSAKYWISVGFNGDVPDKKLRDLVKRSYELVVDGLPLKDQREIKGE